MSLREEAGKETRVLLSPHPRTLAARWQGGREESPTFHRQRGRGREPARGLEVKARPPPPSSATHTHNLGLKEVRGAASAALPETHPRASVCLHRRAPGAFYHLLQSALTAAGAEQDGEEEGVLLLLLLGFFPERERDTQNRREITALTDTGATAHAHIHNVHAGRRAGVEKNFINCLLTLLKHAVSYYTPDSKPHLPVQ